MGWRKAWRLNGRVLVKGPARLRVVLAGSVILALSASACRLGDGRSSSAPSSTDVERQTAALTALGRAGWALSTCTTTNICGGTLANATDGNAATAWTTAANQATTQFFKVDMLTAQTFVGLGLDAGTNVNNFPRAYTVAVSTNDSTYTTVASGTGTTPLVNVAFAAQTARYIKVTLAATATAPWSIAEVNVYGTALVRTGWALSASPAGTGIANAIDASSTTKWTSGVNQASGQYFQIDMLDLKSISKITLDAGTSTGEYPRALQVLVSRDGASTTFTSVAATATGTSQLVTVSFPSVEARYVRIALTGAATSFWSIFDVNVFGSSTPPAPLPRTGWATAAGTASTPVPGNGSTLANAFDGSTTSRWTTGAAQASGNSFKLDMLAPQSFSQITIDAGSSTTDYPRAYQVFVSNDGTNFGTAIASGTGTTALVTVAFPLQNARYVKIALSAAATSWWSIAELNVYGPSFTRNGWAATSSTALNGTSYPSNALDGSATTRWTTGANQANGQTFQVDMVVPETFSGLTLDAGTSTGQYPRGYQVFVSSDGVSWGSAIATGTGTTELLTIAFPMQTARFLKVVQTGAATTPWTIQELNVWRACGVATCVASDQCHTAVCDPVLLVCASPAKANGTACNDANACTTGETCQAGACAGGTAVTCAAADQCHTQGACVPASGCPAAVAKPNGTTCNDNSACTTGDACLAGACKGTAVTCAAKDQCHVAGTCNSATGTCGEAPKLNGTACDDADPSTQGETCELGVCRSPSSYATSSYLSLEDLGTLGGTSSNPVGINDAGDVVGNSTTAAGLNHAFSWKAPGPMVDVGAGAGFPATSAAVDINDGGAIGGTLTEPSGSHHAFRYEGMTVEDLGPGGDDLPDTFADRGSYVNAINASGQLGGYFTNGGDTRGFRYTNGVGFEDVGALSGRQTIVEDISDSGIVVGASWVPGAPQDGSIRKEGHAFMRNDVLNELVDLNQYVDPVSGWTLINGKSISPNGIYIVGSGDRAGILRGYRLNTTTGVVDEISTGWTSDVYPYSVNDTGDVAGTGFPAAGATLTAWVYTDEGGFRTLNDLVGASSGWDLQIVSAINASGDITGGGTTQGQSRGFRLRRGLTCATSCPAPDQCHLAGACNPLTGACVNPPKINGSTCDDGIASTTDETCQLGTCRSPSSYPAISNLAVDDLGQLGGGYSAASDLNASGEVVGDSTVADGSYHAFSWFAPDLLIDLGGDSTFLPSSSSNGVNEDGTVVGAMSDASGSHAFMYDSIDLLRDLGVGGDNSVATDVFDYQGAAAYDVNASNQISGWFTLGSVIHGFLYTNGAFEDIGSLQGGETVGDALSDAGVVVGSSWVLGEPGGYTARRLGHAVMWDPATRKLVDLNEFVPPGSGWTLDVASDISHDGRYIVGTGERDGVLRAFRLDTTTGTLDEVSNGWPGDTYGTGVNDRGDVAGWGHTDAANTLQTGFIYTDQIGFKNLNDIIDPSSGWNLEVVGAINANGDVAGWGRYQNEYRAFRLTRAISPFVACLGKAEGDPCDDGNLCLSSETCRAGKCGGSLTPCVAADTCHVAGICQPDSGACTNPSNPGASCAIGTGPNAPTIFEPTDGADCSSATAINDQGTVTGYSDGCDAPDWPDTQQAYPFVIHGQQLTRLPTTTSAPSVAATAVSPTGYVFGNGYNATSGTKSVYLYRPGAEGQAELLPFPAAGGVAWGARSTVGYGDLPSVVGAAATGTGANLWQWASYDVPAPGGAGQVNSLPVPDGFVGDGAALGVDQAGEMVGYYTHADGSRSALLWSPGVGFEDLNDVDPASGWTLETAQSINDAGQIVGFGTRGSARRPFRLDLGTRRVTDLGELGPDFANLLQEATSVNAAGHVVGTAGFAGDPAAHHLDVQVAFVYTDVFGVMNLNDLVQLPPQWILASAAGINDNDEITGIARNQETGERRAYSVTIPLSGGAAPPLDPSKGGPSPDDSVVPIVNCVSIVPGDATYHAILGYDVTSGTNVNIPAGTDNLIAVGGGADTNLAEAPPEWFSVGEHRGVLSVAFQTGSQVTWTLGKTTVKADQSSPFCVRSTTQLGLVDVDASNQAVRIDQPNLASAITPTTTVTQTLPDGTTVVNTPGPTDGRFAVSDEGLANYTIPLWTPPGRAGVQPSLALSYGSRGGEGPIGYGWSLTGLSQVTRCPRTIAQDGFGQAVQFDASAKFCLDGQALIPMTARNDDPHILKFRTEQIGAPSIIAYYPAANSVTPEYFQVTRKDGFVYTYGTTTHEATGRNATLTGQAWTPPASGEDYPGDLGTNFSQVMSWSLAGIRDNSNNKLIIHYYIFEHDLYPANASGPGAYEQLVDSIAYTFSSDPAEAQRSVIFNYDMTKAYKASDPSLTYVAGFAMESTRLLTSIDMWGPPPRSVGTQKKKLHHYDLNYTDGTTTITGRRLLSSIVECDQFSVCKAPVTFSWEAGSSQFRESATAIARALPDGHAIVSLHTTDINGDGLDDLIYRRSAPEPPLSTDDIYYALNTGPGPNGPTFGAEQHLSSFEAHTPTTEEFAVDLDRDGKTDWITYESNNGTVFDWNIYMSNGTGFTKVQEQPGMDEDNTKPFRHYLGDFDGDGLPDVARIFTNSPALHAQWHPGTFPLDGIINSWGVRMNSGGVLGPLLDTAFMAVNPGYVYVSPSLFGDGRSPLLVSDSFTETPILGDDFLGYVIQDKTGASEQNPWTPSHFIPETNLLWETSTNMKTDPAFKYFFIDLNGDGLGDAIKVNVSGGKPTAVRNIGVGFDPLPVAFSTNEFNSQGSADPGVRFMDYNEDGRSDVLFIADDGGSPHGTAVRALVSSGLGSFTGSDDLHTETGVMTNTTNVAFSQASQVGDFNGDGLDDLIKPDATDGKLHVFVRDGKQPDRLIGVQSSATPALTITYDSLKTGVDPWTSDPVYTPGTGCSYPVTCIVRGMWVVSGYDIQNPNGGTSTYRLSYNDGRTDLLGRGFLGFASMTLRDIGRGSRLVSSFDNATAVVGTTSLALPPPRVYPYVHVPKSKVFFQPLDSGRTMATAHFALTWGTFADDPITPGQAYGVFPSKVIDTAIDEGPSGADDDVTITRQEMEQSYNSSGDLTHRIERVALDGDKGDTYTGPSLETTVTPYGTIGLPSDIVTVSTAPNFVPETRETKYDYDPVTFLLNSMTIEPNSKGAGAVWEEVDYTYDRGRMATITETDELGVSRTTASVYDDSVDDAFPVEQRNAMGMRTEVAYDPGLGVLAQQTDPNGVSTRYQYDGFGRLTGESTDGRGSMSRFYGASSTSPYVVTTSGSDGATEIVEHNLAYLETKRSRTDTAGRLFSRDIAYDDFNRPVSLSQPYYDAPTSFTTLNWDLADRLIALGETLDAEPILGLPVLTTDFRGRQMTTTRKVSDSIQEVKTVTLDSGGEVESSTVGDLTTSYEYGPFNQLRFTHRPEGTSTGAAYDNRGRQTKLADPDAGARSLTYNAFGDVLSDTTPSGTTTYVVDALGRDLSATSADGENRFWWDMQPNGLGKLGYSSSPDHIVTGHSYDGFSRESEVAWDVPDMADSPYVFSYTYDGTNQQTNGKVATITYPQAPGRTFELGLSYAENGELASEFDPQSFHAYWNLTDEDAFGHVAGETFGNGVSTTRTFWPSGRLHTTTSSFGSTQIQSLTTDFYLGGNLKSRVDATGPTALTETFDYDPVGRLGRWTGSGLGAWSYDYGYNAGTQGLASKTPTNASDAILSMSYDYPSPSTGPSSVTTAAGTRVLAYDVDGRRGADGGKTTTFTWRDLPKTTQGPNGLVTFKYDAFGQRVLKMGPDEIWLTLGDDFEARVDRASGATSYIYTIANQERPVGQIMWDGATTKAFYFHDDERGNIDRVSDDLGQASWFRYDPFGRLGGVDGAAMPSPAILTAVRRGFLGRNRDDDLGWINLGGRVYDPSTASFLSSDPLVSNPFDPRVMNRYAYGWNDPMNVSDPTGLEGTKCEGTPMACDPTPAPTPPTTPPPAPPAQPPPPDPAPAPAPAPQTPTPTPSPTDPSQPISAPAPSGGGASPTGAAARIQDDNGVGAPDRPVNDPSSGGNTIQTIVIRDQAAITDPSWLIQAETQLGTGAYKDGTQNPKLQEYYDTAFGAGSGKVNPTKWCATFGNWALVSVGYAGTGSPAAASFTTSKNFVRVPGPVVGAFAVRNDGHHVTIVKGADPSHKGSIVTAGGNQGGRVGERFVTYGHATIDSVQYFWPAAAPPPAQGPLPNVDYRALNAQTKFDH